MTNFQSKKKYLKINSLNFKITIFECINKKTVLGKIIMLSI